MAIGPMPISCWMTRATNVLLAYVILIAFPGNYGHTKTPQYYAIRTLSALFIKEMYLSFFNILKVN